MKWTGSTSIWRKYSVITECMLLFDAWVVIALIKHSNVTEIFKTPGKLRGKTPRTIKRHNALESRLVNQILRSPNRNNLTICSPLRMYSHQVQSSTLVPLTGRRPSGKARLNNSSLHCWLDLNLRSQRAEMAKRMLILATTQ